MNTKYNNAFVADYYHKSDKSYFEKYLQEEIDFLLTASANELHEVKFDDIYVSKPDEEDTLRKLLKPSFSDKIIYLTGVTGVGKTMLLRKVFQIHNMTPIIIDDTNTMVIPISFDNIKKSMDEDMPVSTAIKLMFSDIISNACEYIENTFSDINIPSESNINTISDFYKFLKTQRGDIAQYSNTFPRLSIIERISSFARDDTLTFNCGLLKYYLNQPACSIDNVIFIVDDVEGVGGSNEIIPVNTIFEVMTCMQNPYEKKCWTANAIISCRHYVYRLIRYGTYLDSDDMGEIKQLFESYSRGDLCPLNSPPPILEIVEKRYDAIFQIKKNQRWVDAMNVIKFVLVDIDDTVVDFLLNLNIKNARSTLSTIKTLVYNRRWIQRDYKETVSGAFRIESIRQYDTTPATLIRAIGMEESQIYSSNESIIPNLLRNTQNEDDHLFILLTLKYFMELSNYKHMNWNNSLDIEKFYHETDMIFKDAQYQQYFKDSIQYLLTKRMLLRSIDQLQIDTKPVSSSNANDMKKVYVSDAALDLWKN